MAKDGQEKGFSRWRHPIRAGNTWFDGPQISRREALLLGILGTLLVTAFFATLGILLAAVTVVNFEGKVPVWLAVGATVLGLGLGTAGGAFAIRRLYHAPKLGAVTARFEASEGERQNVEDQLQKVKGQFQEVVGQLEKAKTESLTLSPISIFA